MTASTSTNTDPLTTWFWVMTVSLPAESGLRMSTHSGTVELPPTATRRGLYRWVRDQLPEDLREGSVVLFYDAAPNEITVPAGVVS